MRNCWANARMVLGDSEIKRIERFLKHCDKLRQKGLIRSDTHENTMHDMLLILDGMEIKPQTLYVITVMYALRYWDNVIPEEPYWAGINYMLTAKLSVALEYEDGIAHFTKNSDYMTMNEWVRINKAKYELDPEEYKRTMHPDPLIVLPALG